MRARTTGLWLCLVMVAAFCTGCLSTTSELQIDGVGTWRQPKDIAVGTPGIEVTAPNGVRLTIQNYNSNANVQAMQVQADAITNVTSATTQAAVRAALAAAGFATVDSGGVGSNAALAAKAASTGGVTDAQIAQIRAILQAADATAVKNDTTAPAKTDTPAETIQSPTK